MAVFDPATAAPDALHSCHVTDGDERAGTAAADALAMLAAVLIVAAVAAPVLVILAAAARCRVWCGGGAPRFAV